MFRQGGREPSVALAPCAHHLGEPEEQRTLLSWAEFMADEPDEPKRRGRKAQAPAPSLFEWTLDREAELVGAGRETAQAGGGRH